MRPIASLVLIALSAPLLAGDGPTPPSGIAVGPELLLGTEALEVGAVLEVHPAGPTALDVRPELFINDDARLGAGIGLLWDITRDSGLAARQRLEVGPRAVVHNTDDSSWELGGIITWAFGVGPGRHAVEAIGAVGIVHDHHHDDLDLALTLGVAYLFAP